MGRESKKVFDSLRNFFSGFENSIRTQQQYQNAADLVRGQIRKVRMSKVPVLNHAELYVSKKEEAARDRLRLLMEACRKLPGLMVRDYETVIQRDKAKLTEHKVNQYRSEMEGLSVRFTAFCRKVSHGAELRYEESLKKLPGYQQEGRALTEELKHLEDRVKAELSVGDQKGMEAAPKVLEEPRERMSLETIHRNIRELITESETEEKNLKALLNGQLEGIRPFQEFIALHQNPRCQYAVIERDLPHVASFPGVSADHARLGAQWKEAYEMAERQLQHGEQTQLQIREKMDQWKAIRKEAAWLKEELLKKQGQRNKEHQELKQKARNSSQEISKMLEDISGKLRIMEEKKRQLSVTMDRVKERAAEEKRILEMRYQTIRSFRNQYLDQRQMIRIEGVYNSLRELLRHPFCQDNARDFKDTGLPELSIQQFKEKHNREFIYRKKKEWAVYFQQIVSRPLTNREVEALLVDEVVEEIHVNSLKECQLMEQAKETYLMEKMGVKRENILFLKEHPLEPLEQWMNPAREYAYVMIREYDGNDDNRIGEEDSARWRRQQAYEKLVSMKVKVILFLAQEQESLFVKEMVRRGIRTDDFRKKTVIE